MNKKIILLAICLITTVSLVIVLSASQDHTAIGIITPLSGEVAFWGESTVKGAILASEELEREGKSITLIIEDGQLDARQALTAAQKLVEVDEVDALYSEYTPAALAVSSYLKQKELLHVYAAAVVSSLNDSNNNYKTYIDYERNCEYVAQYLKNNGVKQVGMLKMQLEFAELCEEGINKVYPDVFVEDYVPGEIDFRTMIQKLNDKDIEALVNVGFPSEVEISVRQAREQGFQGVFVTVADAITTEFSEEHQEYLGSMLVFGLPTPSEELVQRLQERFPGEPLGSAHAAALAYIHVKQIGNALTACDQIECVRNSMDAARPEESIGFDGFKEHIAIFKTPLYEWKGDTFVAIK